jgi:cellobiose phosphorylase
MTKHGYFSKDDKFNSFILTDPMTPRPWQQYLFNETMLFQVDQFGQGLSRYWDEKGRDVELNESNMRSFIIRNEDGSSWSPLVVPFGTVPENYRCEYHPAFWQVSGHTASCKVEVKVFIPLTASVEFWTATISNTSSSTISRDIFIYLPVNLMGYSIQKYRFYSATTMYIQGFKVPESNAIWVKNGIPELPHDKYNVFLASETPYESMDTDRTRFLGITGQLNAAAALKNARCSNTDGYFGKTCLAMHHHLTLAPGETKTLRYLTGPTSGSSDVGELCRKYLNGSAFSEEEHKVMAKREQERKNSEISSGIPALDSLANTWSKRQNRLGVLHRKGFRDVLQDSSGMLAYDLERAKEGIEEVLSVQKPDGSGIRAWKPSIDAEPYSDGPYWLILSVADYLKETGDLPFLDKQLPYFGTEARESVWQHLTRAAEHLFGDRSEYGICRIRFADWNDGLDGVGRRGKGDSTMVTFSLIAALRELANIAKFASKTLSYDSDAWIAELQKSLEKHAWTGEYYIRGYRDDGQPYGSPENKYGQIYLNPQAWAVLADAVPLERRQKLLELTIKRLGTAKGLRLFTPCYPAFDPYLGRVSAELPGVYENGAMYNHAAAFFLHALSKAGMKKESWKFLEMMLPDNMANPSDKSGAEPFVLTNCIFGEEAKHRAGTSYFGWYTGTAAWVLRLIHNCYTGLTPEFDGLHVRPEMIPSEIKIKSYRRSFRDTEYVVHYNKGGKPSITVDGTVHDRNIPLPIKTGQKVEVKISY